MFDLLLGVQSKSALESRGDGWIWPLQTGLTCTSYQAEVSGKVRCSPKNVSSIIFTYISLLSLGESSAVPLGLPWWSYQSFFRMLVGSFNLQSALPVFWVTWALDDVQQARPDSPDPRTKWNQRWPHLWMKRSEYTSEESPDVSTHVCMWLFNDFKCDFSLKKQNVSKTHHTLPEFSVYEWKACKAEVVTSCEYYLFHHFLSS